MKLLVFGGAGYIGSVVAARLLASRHTVTVADNLERGHAWAVPPDARLVRVDLADEPGLDRRLGEGFDGLLHFAALSIVPESVAEPVRYYRANVGGTLTPLEAMRQAETPRLVFSSTAAVYGEPGRDPDHRGGADAADEPVRRVEAGRRRGDRPRRRGERLREPPSRCEGGDASLRDLHLRRRLGRPAVGAPSGCAFVLVNGASRPGRSCCS